MDLNELYKEIEKAEVDLNAKKNKVHQRGISGERWKYKAKIQRI